MATKGNPYRKLLKQRQQEYNRIGIAHCPVLEVDVYFTSKGFRHLRYERPNVQRKIRLEMYKMGLIPLAKHVVEGAFSEYLRDLVNRGPIYSYCATHSASSSAAFSCRSTVLRPRMEFK